MHISVGSSKEDLMRLVSSTKCPLCSPPNDYFVRSRILRHFMHCHLRHFIETENKLIVLCKLDCESKVYGGGHYHCFACPYTCRRQERVIKHITRHNFASRILDVHNQILNKQKNGKVRSKLVDNVSGIHIVSRYRDGDNVPIHVIFKVSVSDSQFRCSYSKCEKEMKLAQKRGLYNYICSHLRKIKPETFKQDEWLRNELLAKTDLNLDSSQFDAIKNRQVNAVVPWDHSEEYYYYSVLCETSQNSPLGRTFVKINRSNSEWSCGCGMATPNKLCNHMQLVLLYKQKDMKGVENSLPDKLHPSIGASENEFFEKLALTQCFLCPQPNDHEANIKLTRHFISCHLNHSIELDDRVILLCKLQCGKYSLGMGHYHCFSCSLVVKDQAKYFEHLDAHYESEEVSDSEKNALRSKFVDESSGIYIVPDEDNCSPVHVLARTAVDFIDLKCSLLECQLKMDLAKESGPPNLICPHLKRVEPENFIPKVRLSDILNCQILSDQEEKSLDRYLTVHLEEEMDPVVPWTHSQSHEYYSVRSETSKYSPFGRLFVKVCRSTRIFSCECRKPTIMDCAHIMLVKLYLIFLQIENRNI